MSTSQDQISIKTKLSHNQGSGPFIRDQAYFKKESRIWLALGIAGLIMGFSAPGFDQWYLAWFGLCPLLFAAMTSRNVPEAFYRGVPFGFAYTLLYQSTILEFTQDVWPESLNAFIWLANPIIWILVSLQQAALFGTFCSIVRWMPLTNGFLPRRVEGRRYMPALLLIPLVWCLIHNKLGNSQLSWGIPWCLLEYTQYNQKQFLQIANIIGGIGVSALIVMTNVSLMYFLSSFNFIQNRTNKIVSNLKMASINLIMVLTLLACSVVYGADRIKTAKQNATVVDHETVTVLQGNVLFGMAGKSERNLVDSYLNLAKQAPPSICVWPEWAYPASYHRQKEAFNILRWNARKNGQSWIVGCLDDSSPDKAYNAICGINSDGEVFEPVYRKRYLVPFAEYTPSWVLNSPLGFLCGTLTPRRVGYSAGDETIPLELHGKKIAPLLCCELASPELTAEGVRNGGQLIIDCSNTSWFDSVTIGKQCIAAAVLRAIENHRCLAFATTLGPSAIVDGNGFVLVETPRNKSCWASKSVPFHNDITIFNKWFR